MYLGSEAQGFVSKTTSPQHDQVKINNHHSHHTNNQTLFTVYTDHTRGNPSTHSPIKTQIQIISVLIFAKCEYSATLNYIVSLHYAHGQSFKMTTQLTKSILQIHNGHYESQNTRLQQLTVTIRDQNHHFE